ncbi:MAG: IS4 family transposase [Cyanobacteria bacterium J06649_11]
MFPLPELYREHLNKNFNKCQYLILIILINLLRTCRTVRLEELARKLPVPIKLRSRVKKIQRFLSLPQFEIKTLWFPIIESWLEAEWKTTETVYLAIDRSQWRNINLLMVSLIYNRRAIPLYFKLLDKKGNSNLARQKEVLSPVLELLSNYQIVILGDREFCGVELGRWLLEQESVDFALRLRKNEYVELESQIWFQLSDLGLAPGMSAYFQGIKVTKTKGFAGFNLAAKWQKNYRQKSSQEPWFLLTSLPDLNTATTAYTKRMGIEEMFRDFKLGGYNLESTRVTDARLISMILLICLSYSSSTFMGHNLKVKGVADYIARPTEPKRAFARSSSFSIGFNSQTWADYFVFFQDIVLELLSYSPHKLPHYLKGMRAISLIQSSL